MEIKGLVARTANRAGFLDFYAFSRRILTKSQVAILLYHSVRPRNDDWSGEPLSPQNFDRQMEYFSRNYEILSLDELAAGIHRKRPLPAKSIAITFDDGYKDNYLYAYPILKKYHMPATIFLATGHIGTGKLFWWDRVRYAIEHTPVTQMDLVELGNYSFRSKLGKLYASSTIIDQLKKLPEDRRNFLSEKLVNTSRVAIPPYLGNDFILSWDEIKEMSGENITFGAHSVSHPILTRTSLGQAKHQIVQSKKEIEERLKQPVKAFSYPEGEYNPEIVKLVRESGFAFAVSVLPGKLIGYNDNVYTLSRIEGINDFSKFKVQFCGLLGDFQQMLSREGK